MNKINLIASATMESNPQFSQSILEEDRFLSNMSSPPGHKTGPRQEKLALEKKQILAALNEQVKLEKNFLAKINHYRALSSSDENKLLDNLNSFFDSYNKKRENAVGYM